MRKYDYEIFAKIIKEQMQLALDLREILTPRVSDQRIWQCKKIAKDFASSTRIDRDKFLSACGIEKD